MDEVGYPIIFMKQWPYEASKRGPSRSIYTGYLGQAWRKLGVGQLVLHLDKRASIDKNSRTI
jgi:hypothetical protein